MTIYTIYLITNLINNKKYVGQSKEYKRRFAQHKHTKTKSLISGAIQKYDIDNFTFEVIYQTLNVDQVDFLECHFIKEHNSLSHSGGHGYNIDLGGNKNKIMSEETRSKLSNALLGNTRTKGRSHTKEAKQKISEATQGTNNPFYGKTHSEETKKQMSESAKIKIFTEEHRNNIRESQLGKKHSEETKRIMSTSRKGKRHTIKKVTCPHCEKIGGANIMHRYHFNNCKVYQTQSLSNLSCTNIGKNNDFLPNLSIITLLYFTVIILPTIYSLEYSNLSIS